MDVAILFSYIILFIYRVSTITSSNVCLRTTTHANKAVTIYYCCQNYVSRNAECVECAAGYTSENGSSCYPCTPGYYGKACGYLCSCTSNQTCHHIFGCLEISTTIMQKQTDKYTDESITRTLVNSSITHRDSTKDPGIVENPTGNGENPTKHPGMARTISPVLIYTILAGGLVMCIGLAVLCGQHCHTVLQRIHKLTIQGADRPIPNNQQSAMETYFEESANVYDLIDEENVVDDFEINSYNFIEATNYESND